MKKLLLLSIMLLSLVSFANDKDIYYVGVYPSPPFIIEEGTELSGVSIEMWEHIAQELRIRFEYVIYPNDISAILNEVANDSLDFVISSVTINGEREKLVDFSHPFYSTFISIATSMQQKNSIQVIFATLISKEFLNSFILFIIILFILGIISFFLERKTNDFFDDHPAQGIFNAFYFQVMLYSTVGLGDIFNKTNVGKAVTIFAILLYMLFGAAIIGQMSSALTVNHFEGSINSLNDLKKVKTGTIRATTSQTFLDVHDIKYYQYKDIPNSLDALEGKELDAIVYDRPVLDYYITERGLEDIRLLEQNYGVQQNYGIVMTEGCSLKEAINIELLKLTVSDKWNDILKKYNLNN